MRIPLPPIRSVRLVLAVLVMACGDESGPGGGGVEPVVRVVVSPANDSVPVAGLLTLDAQAFDSLDQPVAGASFSWRSTAPAVATVSVLGVVTGVSVGQALVIATAGQASDTALVTVTALPPASAILIAAGDIADCSRDQDDATATLLDSLAGQVAVLGDNAYEDGTLAEYTNCYGPTWGRHKARTRPAVGNHEYQTAGAAGYWAYWGAQAGTQGQGYYSYSLGSWHIVVLNSNCGQVSCAAGSAQEQWLRADLAADSSACTLAYFHHPRFSSGAAHGNNAAVQPLWQALYDAGADVVLNGHEHLYERFAPQTPTGVADPAAGLRQFTVGTGGRSLHAIGTLKPNSQVIDAATFGVLRLTLAPAGYDWQFLRTGGSFTDQGSGSCH